MPRPVALIRTLLILAVAGTLVVLGAAEGIGRLRHRAITRAMPPAWGELFRQRTRLPAAVRALAAATAVPGDGAAALDDATPGLLDAMPLDSAYARAQQGTTAARDTLIWSQLEEDPVLAVWTAAAARAEWRGFDRMLARTSAAARGDALRLRRPDYGRAMRALEALALRGWVRAGRGDTAGARRDLGAVVAAGARLVRHEPSLDGFLAGRAAVQFGAAGWRRLAARIGDTTLARLADEAAAWSAPSTAVDYSILPAVPESALAFARDTALALGWRAEAMLATIRGPLLRPSGRLFGLPDKVRRGLAPLARGTGDAARFAGLAIATADAIDALPPWTRWRRFRDLDKTF